MKLYQKSSAGKIKFLDIKTDGSKLITEWGILGGKTQKTVKVCKRMNAGKANELSAKQQALTEMESKIILKKKEGYENKIPDDKINTSDTKSLNLDKLPTEFCPCKPISDCPGTILNSETTIAQRKHNGHCVFLVKGSKQTFVYSRRMENITPQCFLLPFIGSQLDKLSAGDFVLTEITFFHTKLNLEIPRYVAQVIRNEDPKEAFKRYAELSKIGIFTCHPFDILFRKNSFVGNKEYVDRHAILNAMKLENIPDILEWKGPESDLVTKARRNKWEGFVLRTIGSKSTIGYSMDGKAHRQGSYKFKFTKTGDFIVDEAFYGISGKHSHFFSKFHIIEYGYGSAGETVPIDRGYVGPGTLSHEQLTELTNELKSGKRKIPFVVEVEYASIHDDTGKLQFGIIQRIRDDKAPAECIAEDE